MKQGSNSVQDNVCKKYYVILLPRTLVIFFWDSHGFIIKFSIMMNVPFIWGMRHMKWSWNLWHQDKPRRINTHVEGENKKRKNRKRRNTNCRRKDNWRKRKGSKEKDDGKGCSQIRCLIEGRPCLVAIVYESDNNDVSQRLVEKLKLPTSFHPNQARIKFNTGQSVKEVLCDIAPTNSCHLLFRWAWLHFKTLNLD